MIMSGIKPKVLHYKWKVDEDRQSRCTKKIYKKRLFYCSYIIIHEEGDW
jgi:hypothetical protein